MLKIQIISFGTAKEILVLRPDFFLWKKKSDLGSGHKEKNAQRIRAFFFNIFRKNSKTSKVNQQSVLNL